MLSAFWWILIVQAIGLAVFPLAYFLFPKLSDRGYSVSKPLGILLIGYVSWTLSQAHILPSVRLSIVALLLLLAGLSGWYAWRQRQALKEFALRERKAIIAAELIFLVFFIGWVIYRSYDPAIDHTEQPMDHMLLNASIQTDIGAPEDAWLRGESVSYYYFGYWMMGVISQIGGIPSNISYNLALALIPALGAMGMFGLVHNMVRADSGRWNYALVGGCAAAVVLVMTANLEGVFEFMRANTVGSQGFWEWLRIDGLDGPAPDPTDTWMPQENWWWFRSTRVINTFADGGGIDYTIQEFPFFSFMLGDLHPHVMSIPFVILFLALSLNFFRSPVHVWSRRDWRSYASVLAIGLSLGGLAFTNMWDLPVFLALFTAIAALQAHLARGALGWEVAIGAAAMGLAALALAILLFLPYYLTFRAGVGGIDAVTIATTRPVHMLIVWAVFLVSVTPFIVISFWQTVVREDWPRLTAAALFVGFTPYAVWACLYVLGGGDSAGALIGRFVHVLPFAALVSMAVYTALWLGRWGEQNGRVFGLALAALGLLLIMGPELLFVDDSFGPPSERMNTVFKLYYQAWILLAAVSGYALYYWGSLREVIAGWKHSLTALWAAAFVALLIGALYFPPASAASKADLPHGEPTLDGLAFLNSHRPEEYEAINFIKERRDGESAILEAVGEWGDAGLISRSTGMPTVLSWPGHQLQWRPIDAAYEGREADVARIYQTEDVEEARDLLAKYEVDYVYVGPREKDKYGEAGLAKFAAFMDVVFSQGSVMIYHER